jgi:IS5 family transposase
VSVNKKHKFIRKIESDTASTHDSQHFEAVIDTANTSRNVYADRGYPSAEREAWLKAHCYLNRIQRKGHRNQPLSAAQQRRNHRIATTRARVEHVFVAVEQMGRKLIQTIGQARTGFALTMMAACRNLKRLAYFQQGGIVAF